MDIKMLIDGVLRHHEFTMKHGVSGLPSVNHMVRLGHLEQMAAKHLCSAEITEKVCHDCNFLSDDGRPFCGNCMYASHDPETGLCFCEASVRSAEL